MTACVLFPLGHFTFQRLIPKQWVVSDGSFDQLCELPDGYWTGCDLSTPGHSFIEVSTVLEHSRSVFVGFQPTATPKEGQHDAGKGQHDDDDSPETSNLIER